MRFGALEQGFERGVVEPAQHKHLRARQQRTDQLEGRVFGRCADQDHRAVFDIGQESVLLGAVEAVDLVDEQQRAVPHLAPLLGRLEHLAQIGDAGKHRRQRLEGEIRTLRQEARDRRLAAAGRPPQDHRGKRAARDHVADRTLRPDQMILADDVGKALGPQPVGQGPRRLGFKQRAHRPANICRIALICRDIIEYLREVAFAAVRRN